MNVALDHDRDGIATFVEVSLGTDPEDILDVPRFAVDPNQAIDGAMSPTVVGKIKILEKLDRLDRELKFINFSNAERTSDEFMITGEIGFSDERSVEGLDFYNEFMNGAKQTERWNAFREFKECSRSKTVR